MVPIFNYKNSSQNFLQSTKQFQMDSEQAKMSKNRYKMELKWLQYAKIMQIFHI